MRHDSFHLTWRVHTWRDWCIIDIKPTSKVTHTLIFRSNDAFICNRLVHMRHDSFICNVTSSYVTWLIHMLHQTCVKNVPQLDIPIGRPAVDKLRSGLVYIYTRICIYQMSHVTHEQRPQHHNQALHFTAQALHSTKRALHSTTRIVQIAKRALQFAKRALQFAKRALHPFKRALNSTKNTHHSTQDSRISKFYRRISKFYRRISKFSSDPHCRCIHNILPIWGQKGAKKKWKTIFFF